MGTQIPAQAEAHPGHAHPGSLSAPALPSEAALPLETPEPAFYYHAGLIAAALGKSDDAARRLARARELNAAFDPVQGGVLRRALAAVVH